MITPKSNANDLQKRARYLQSIACFVTDAEKHDELLAKAHALMADAVKKRDS